MERTIKFRAFDKEAKTMHKVSQIDFDYQFALLETSDGDYFQKHFSQIELMQFTGLYDKHGKEIYEGDVVKNLKGTSIVSFENGCFYVKFRNCRYRLGGFDKTFIEIIGNIHQNPELLK